MAVDRILLRRLRQERGLKLGEAADALEHLRRIKLGAGVVGAEQGIRSKWLANIESGHGNPSIERTHLLAEFYGVAHGDLDKDATTEPETEAAAGAIKAEATESAAAEARAAS